VSAVPANDEGARQAWQRNPDDLANQVAFLEHEVAVLRRKLAESPRQSRAMDQRLVAAEKQRRQGAAERLAGAVAEEALERCVDVAQRSRGDAGIEHREREAARAERGARKRAVREQPVERRGGFGCVESLDGLSLRERHGAVLPRFRGPDNVLFWRRPDLLAGA